MSREAVILLSNTGKTMAQYFENKFHDAIYTDLHIITDEPDAMISLFMMEQEAHWICVQLQPIMSEMAKIVLEDGLKEIFHHFTS
tara:strand:+ start:4356 stop:4610 length:255 start_codon:yes stop_codon:yes gene_type:complete